MSQYTEIEIIGSKNKVGKEDIKVQLKLFEACFMAVSIYGLEAWGYIKKEIREYKERLSKEYLHCQSVQHTHTGILIETGL